MLFFNIKEFNFYLEKFKKLKTLSLTNCIVDNANNLTLTSKIHKLI